MLSQCLDANSCSSQQKFKEIDRKPLTLKEAILKNLIQQPAIKVALYNINIQQGIAQSSAAPFDPVVNSQFFHTYTRDLINLAQDINTLDLGQDLIPLAGIPIDEIPGANPLNPAVNLTPAQQRALCSCPSDSSCLNRENSNELICPPAVHTHLQAHETTAHIDVAKKYRDGTRILFSLDIDQYHNPILCPKRLNIGRTTLEINKPLLRDNRYGLDYMTELANKQEVNATRYDALQTISEQVLETIFLFWDTLSAKKILEAQKESEERLKELVDNVQFLIQREQLAAADLLQPLAQLSSQIVSRIQAEQNYYDVQQRLKFAMGEWDEECPCRENEFKIAEDFPKAYVNPMDFSKIFCQLFPQVFHQRFNILASLTREGIYFLLLKGAKNLELPQLNVVGRASLTEFTSCSKAENFFSSLEYVHPQKDFTIGVVFSTPIFRDEAKGLVRQRQAQWAQTQANTQLLKQQTLADINSALKDQIHLQQEIQKAQEAVEEYQQLLKNERKKLVAGYSTIFILLSFESSLTSALINYIQLLNQMAKNIARIRFLTGTLIYFSPFHHCDSFLVSDALSLPFLSTHKERECGRTIE